MRSVLPAEPAILAKLVSLSGLLFIPCSGIISPFAITARQMNNIPHNINQKNYYRPNRPNNSADKDKIYLNAH